MNKISILITDDHVFFVEGFARALKYNHTIGKILSAGSGKEAIHLLQTNSVDIVFMDLSMKEMNGIEASKIILQQFPNQKIIILSQFDDMGTIVKCIKLGAKGYLSKLTSIDVINTAIREVMNGHVFYSDDILKAIELNNTPHPKLPILEVQLTEQEITILKLICKGFNHKEIAVHLDKSQRTVEWHKENLLKKTKQHNSAGLVSFAVLYGYYKL